MPKFSQLYRRVTDVPPHVAAGMTVCDVARALHAECLKDCDARLVLWLRCDHLNSGRATDVEEARFVVLMSILDRVRRRTPEAFDRLLSSAPLSEYVWRSRVKHVRGPGETRSTEYCKTGANYIRSLLLCVRTRVL